MSTLSPSTCVGRRDAASAMLGFADSHSNKETLIQVLLHAPSSLAVDLDLGFELLEWDLCRWEDLESQCVQFEAYFATPLEADAFACQLREMLGFWQVPATWKIEQRELAAGDWQERWKAHFHVLHASARIVIRPVWIPYDPQPHERVVSLEPGMSFGTGQHFTTQSCIQLLDELAPENAPSSLFDAGCGSGILSIAAAKLGYGPIVALDNDPLCVAMTRENARLNGLGEDVIDVRLSEGDLSIGEQRFDVVVANILATVLVHLCPAISCAVSASSCARLILSGIMTSQAASVEDAYCARGFHVLKRLADGEWMTLLLCRRDPLQ